MRTAFFANVARQVGDADPDDPYAGLITCFNTRMAALGSAGQSAESVADVICDIAADSSPALRYHGSVLVPASSSSIRTVSASPSGA